MRAALLAALLIPAAHAQEGNRGRTDYVLHCSGCHKFDGRGLEDKGIPALKDQIGYYLALPEGRAFLMQIPGLLGAGMSDQRAADVTNYVVLRFAGQSLPQDFTPYTAEEARRHRENRPSNIPATRRALAAKLQEQGVSIR
jgi:mono/diheme cytochrome c family protein